MSRHLLLGSGIAALTAAEAIRQSDPSARLLMVSEEADPFYSRPGLAYLLKGDVPERQLRIRSPREIEELGLERVTGRVARVSAVAHQVTLADGRKLGFDRLLLATGAASIAPAFSGAELRGVVQLDSLADARGILRLAGRGRTAVVVGGGSTALELVEGFRARGMGTHYFMRGDRYWARVLDPVESALVEARLVESGVRLHRHIEVAAAVGHAGRLRAVVTTTGERIPCDLLAVATGVRPRLQLAQEAGLAVERGILVDESLETSDPDIFAAGDVAQAYDPTAARSVLDTLWSTAEAQGRVAGLNMAGGRVAYRKRVARNVTCLAGVVTAVIGDVGGEDDLDLITITRGQSEAWSGGPATLTVTERGRDDRIRLRLGPRTIVGAVIMGTQSLAERLSELIADQTDLSSLLPALWERPASLGALLERFGAGRAPAGDRNVQALVAR
jgi:NADPH-dependent 2,4-dienoyl-CoA reductase/sulfur reductase-like enzyme